LARGEPMTRIHPKSQLAPRGLRPKHSFGQNFLNDDTHLSGIAGAVEALAKAPARLVVEFGPGTGALTAHLVERELLVHAVERDRDLIPVLSDRFAERLDDGRLVLHEANAATFPVGETFRAHGEGVGVLCGNLPYHMTSSLLMNALDVVDNLAGAVFLIQLEVAERISAGPGSKTYGILSVVLQHRFDVRLDRIVPKGAFWPVPEVDGGVVVLTPRAEPRGGEVSLEVFKRVVKSAFSSRRKTLRNALKSFPAARELMESVGINPGARAEELDVEAFVALARAVEAAGPLGPDVDEGTGDA